MADRIIYLSLSRNSLAFVSGGAIGVLIGLSQSDKRRYAESDEMSKAVKCASIVQHGFQKDLYGGVRSSRTVAERSLAFLLSKKGEEDHDAT
jgi:hypothetical protein